MAQAGRALFWAGLIRQGLCCAQSPCRGGISSDEENNLRRIISEAQGSDPVVSRKTQYESTGNLGDLINLVAELEEHQHWDDLCEYGISCLNKHVSLKEAEQPCSCL